MCPLLLNLDQCTGQVAEQGMNDAHTRELSLEARSTVHTGFEC